MAQSDRSTLCLRRREVTEKVMTLLICSGVIRGRLQMDTQSIQFDKWRWHQGCLKGVISEERVLACFMKIKYVPLGMKTQLHTKMAAAKFRSKLELYSFYMVEPFLGDFLPGITPRTHNQPPSSTRWYQWHGPSHHAWLHTICLMQIKLIVWRQGVWLILQLPTRAAYCTMCESHRDKYNPQNSWWQIGAVMREPATKHWKMMQKCADARLIYIYQLGGSIWRLMQWQAEACFT